MAPTASAVFAAGPHVLPKKRGGSMASCAKVPKQHASDTPGSVALQAGLAADKDLQDMVASAGGGAAHGAAAGPRLRRRGGPRL